MKLKDLVSKITIQGDIRISVWDEDDEVEVLEISGSDRLTSFEIDRYKNMRVKYMFAGADNMLHIELDPSKVG